MKGSKQPFKPHKKVEWLIAKGKFIRPIAEVDMIKEKRVKKKDFCTDNLQLAAYLFAKEIPILRVERSGRFGIFHFSTDQAKSEIEKFIAGDELIEPIRYSQAFRELRFKVDQVQDESGRN